MVRPKRALSALIAAATVALAPGAAHASQILVPSVGTADTALAGATVATPLTPTAAAFSNPAGITALPADSFTIGIGVPVGHSHVHATTPAGYDTTSDFVAYAPDGGAIFDVGSRLRLGVAVYGSLGAVFDSDADPSVGVPHDFLSSQSISNASLMMALPLTSRLSVGAALSLLYGQSHLRYFTADQFAYTVRGPGVQAIFGLRYQLNDQVAFGLGGRTPGMAWERGDDALASGGHQDVDLDLNLPAQVFVGLNAELPRGFSFGLMGRWTDASTFASSSFRFEQTPQANIPFIRSASDEWRVAAGGSWRATETITLRGGFGYADAIVPDDWVSPLLLDSDEWKISVGLSWQVASWFVDFTAGESPTGHRTVTDSEAVIFPGRYSIGGQIYMIGLRTAL